jgi:hypothetical protein
MTHLKGRQEQRLAEPQTAERQLAERQLVERQPVEQGWVEPELAERLVEPELAERLVEPELAERLVEPDLAERLVEPELAEVRIAFRRSRTSQRAMEDLALPSDKLFRLVPETPSLFFGRATPILAKTGAGTPFWFGATGQPIRLIFGQATSLVPVALVS